MSNLKFHHNERIVSFIDKKKETLFHLFSVFYFSNLSISKTDLKRPVKIFLVYLLISNLSERNRINRSTTSVYSKSILRYQNTMCGHFTTSRSVQSNPTNSFSHRLLQIFFFLKKTNSCSLDVTYQSYGKVLVSLMWFLTQKLTIKL